MKIPFSIFIVYRSIGSESIVYVKIKKISIVYPPKEGIPLNLSKIIGERLRGYRNQLGWSQERLAERANLHPTYIGQLERGEKNATIESISKVSAALDISLSQLFENISPSASAQDIPSRCYDIIQAQPTKEQEDLLLILEQIVYYKHRK